MPDGAERPPVAVVVHGGFWVTENGAVDRMVDVCESLVARGWAAWNVEYRRMGQGGDGGWPHTAADVSAAIDHLAEIAVPLDLERVLSIGHSAGGHLTLLDAARADAAVPVVATVAQARVTDWPSPTRSAAPACRSSRRSWAARHPNAARPTPTRRRFGACRSASRS